MFSKPVTIAVARADKNSSHRNGNVAQHLDGDVVGVVKHTEQAAWPIVVNQVLQNMQSSVPAGPAIRVRMVLHACNTGPVLLG